MTLSMLNVYSKEIPSEGIDGLFTAECVLTSLILFLWQFTHFYALSTKTWSGYSQAHYHMLPLNSTRWAAIWAFVSWVLVRVQNLPVIKVILSWRVSM